MKALPHTNTIYALVLIMFFLTWILAFIHRQIKKNRKQIFFVFVTRSFSRVVCLDLPHTQTEWIDLSETFK